MKSTIAQPDKRRHVLDCALVLMRDHGNHGLTMRRLSAEAGMSLSNVQHYFANKPVLLQSMMETYFADCAKLLRQQFDASHDHSQRERIRRLVCLGLGHGHELTDMCKLFREFWALATRDSAIEGLLMQYYRDLSAQMGDYFTGFPVDLSAVNRVVTLFLPYVEGYSIVASAMPMGYEETVEYLTDLIEYSLSR